MDDSAPLIIGILWVRKEDRILFRKSPHFLKVDTTFNTNEYQRPYFSVSSKTAENTIFSVAQGIIPNEQAWIFNWLFHQALPALLPTELQLVHLIISDGDSTKISQIDQALSNCMPNAKRLRCVWHLNDRKWHRDVYYFPSKKSLRWRFFHAPQESTRLLLTKWTSSWATPTCELQDEMIVSMKLFRYVIESEEMKLTFNLDDMQNLVPWANSVMTNVKEFAFHQRIRLPAFEEISNSTQEANFSSLKKGGHLNKGMLPLALYYY